MAEPGETISTPGASEAVIIEPIGVQNVTDLRFGRIIQPETNGTLRIAPNGTATEQGGVVGNALSTPQQTNGRGPGAMAAFGDPNRFFIVFLPQQTVVRDGASAMRVDNLNWATPAFVGPFTGFTYGQFDNDGYSGILVGGRLNIDADQPVGSYTGTYPLTIFYL
ncbi:MAG: DUF4402 domain-containing protein [Pontixanthobacter sp.]